MSNSINCQPPICSDHAEIRLIPLNPLYKVEKGEVAFGAHNPDLARISSFLARLSQFFDIIGQMGAILRYLSFGKFWPFLGEWRPFWILQISIWGVRIARIKKCI